MIQSKYITIVIVLLFITAGVPINGSAVGSSDFSTTDASLDIGPSIPATETFSSQGSTTEIVVRLTDPRTAALTSSNRPVETMRAASARAQEPLVDYADETAGVEIVKTFWITNAVLLEVDTTHVDLDQINSVDGVDRIHENYKIATQSATASSTAGQLAPTHGQFEASSEEYTYGLQQIDAPNVWSRYDSKGETATVAVLDSGVDVSAHPDLELTENGWNDFVYGWPEPYDDETGHGTHVSGTIVGQQMTEGPLIGVQYGVAPEAELLHGRVSDGGSASFSALLSGMEWAVEHEAGVDVMSISLGAEAYIPDFIAPIRNAKTSGTVVVVSAGNSKKGSSTSPGNIYDAFSIGASAEDETIGSFSSGETIRTAETWGRTAPTDWPDKYVVPDVAAPGVGVYSAVPGGGYEPQSGTSMAAPHITGVVALVQSATNETLTPTEIETVLRRSAWKPAGESSDPDTRYGHGIVNASRAVDIATASDFQINNLTAPTTVSQNNNYEITANITNNGISTGTQSVTYELQNESGVTSVTETTSMTITGGETGSSTLSIAGEETASLSGNYTHVVRTADDTITQPVEITSERTVSFYATSDGRVTPRGLGDAARDFRAGLITPSVLGDVAAAFRLS